MDYVYMGNQIRKRRRELGKTQEWLAKRADVSTSFIGHIERGTKKASIETLTRISLALGTTMDMLVLPPHGSLELEGYNREQISNAQKLLEAALAMSRR